MNLGNHRQLHRPAVAAYGLAHAKEMDGEQGSVVGRCELGGP
jgi:hypothetical protein